MDYALKPAASGETRGALGMAWRALKPLLADERAHIIVAVACVIVSTATGLLGPVITARIIDTAIKHADYGLLLRYAGLLAAVYVLGLATQYVQTLRMGTVGRNVLFKLRGRLFAQLSLLPVSFFAQNRAGDLISRVNSDTDKVNQFFLTGADANVRQPVPGDGRGNSPAGPELENGSVRPGASPDHADHHAPDVALGEGRQPQESGKPGRPVR
jgi:ABC-type multidrug transport system fused ATPase/permease subunit